jgi:hypothetical protein
MLNKAYSIFYTDRMYGFVAQTTDADRVQSIVAQINGHPEQNVIQIIESDRSVRPQVDTITWDSANVV